MTIQFVNPTDYNEVIEKINNRIQDAKRSYKYWKIVEEICKKYEGKKITKRIETELKKQLPEYYIYYSDDYQYTITLWGKEIDNNNKMIFFLGYRDKPYVDMEEILNANMRYELEKGRAEKLEALDLNRIKRMVDTWNHGLSELKSVHEEASPLELGYSYYGFDLNR